MTEDVLLEQFVAECGQLQVEDSGDEVGTIGCEFSRLEVFLDLLPERVACHCQEDVRLPEFCDDGHRILILLIHVSWTADE